jgi:DEAD/DEAH box helicase domain-containing protein
MDTATFLKQIEKLPGYRGQVVHVERLPARRARYGKLDRPLPPTLESALRGIGAERLYRHQAQAINAVRAGQHVILSTGTASGKTLAYNVPVLEALVADGRARALCPAFRDLRWGYAFQCPQPPAPRGRHLAHQP